MLPLLVFLVFLFIYFIDGSCCRKKKYHLAFALRAWVLFLVGFVCDGTTKEVDLRWYNNENLYFTLYFTKTIKTRTLF